jgi:II/X family phage/plasmid replication protein
MGSVDVPTKAELFNQLVKVAPTENYARAAFNTFTLISTIGYESTKMNMPQSTWYKHKKLLNDAGLSLADLVSGEILPFRRKTIVLEEPIQNWEHLAIANQ